MESKLLNLPELVAPSVNWECHLRWDPVVTQKEVPNRTQERPPGGCSGIGSAMGNSLLCSRIQGRMTWWRAGVELDGDQPASVLRHSLWPSCLPMGWSSHARNQSISSKCPAARAVGRKLPE